LKFHGSHEHQLLRPSTKAIGHFAHGSSHGHIGGGNKSKQIASAQPKKGEVRPDQVIPFDDDDDFTNF
ncbi:MAG: hypothetical protein HQK69_10475, partial [Desulfamplus sp.]|nr:hypothetical protein [Desulfamplus sp.]